MLKTVNEHFPEFRELIRSKIIDKRDKRGQVYSIDEAIVSVVLMFLFKEGSRNSYNQSRSERRFTKNIHKLLGVRLLHGDSFEDILKEVDTDCLDLLKAAMVKALIKAGVVTPEKGSEKFVVAVDGTGLHSIAGNHPQMDQSLHKTSKCGSTSYSLGVLEAKLVDSNGLCISLASELIANLPEHATDSQKQDCELKAFTRLIAKIKRYYPDLQVLLVADGLYACVPVIQQMMDLEWDYMLVLKDGCQKDLQQEIALRPDKKTYQGTQQTLHWMEDLELGGYLVSWLEDQQLSNRFCWITNIPIPQANTAASLAKKGRLRWKIENEGFNTQKNHGYALQHKFSRTSFQANYNYYQCLQIAHLIEQLTILTADIKALIKKTRAAVKTLSERLKNALIFQDIDPEKTRRLLAFEVLCGFD